MIDDLYQLSIINYFQAYLAIPTSKGTGMTPPGGKEVAPVDGSLGVMRVFRPLPICYAGWGKSN